MAQITYLLILRGKARMDFNMDNRRFHLWLSSFNTLGVTSA
jgi:hypothetical protein